MRIRSTKPEFWKSRLIASVSWDARLVLKGLESYVDDNGVGVDDIELIVTDVFPRDMFAKGSETVARVSEAITELHHAGLIHRYEATGDRLLYISWWDSIQRIDKPGRGRLPRPDGTFDYKASEIRESVASPPETLAPGTGEQGNRGTGEQNNTSSPAAPRERRPKAPEMDNDFLDFYLAYPRKESRTNASKAYVKARKDTPADVILSGVERYVKSVEGKERQFVALPATWLNQRRWEDDLTPAAVRPSLWDMGSGAVNG